MKWGNETSSCFTISNGVRQGGILSPVLFSICMDDLSVLLSRSGIGCYVDDLCINHVFYADDLCVMAPCAIALQELINVCYEYSIGIDINFNALTLSDPGHFRQLTIRGGGGFKSPPPPYDLENFCVNLHHIRHVNFTRCFRHDPIGIFQKFAILTILQRFQNKK